MFSHDTMSNMKKFQQADNKVMKLYEAGAGGME
jgi:hypothetical protein